MSPTFLEKQSTRREMLRNSAGFAGSALLAQLFPASLLSAGVPGRRQQAATGPTDRLAAMREQMGAVPIQAQPHLLFPTTDASFIRLATIQTVSQSMEAGD